MHTTVIRKRITESSRDVISGVVVGQLTCVTDEGVPLVNFAGNMSPKSLPAKSVERCTESDVGREVVMSFERGHADKPVIMGFLQPCESNLETPKQQDVDRLVFSANDEIVLRCKKSSMTLTKGGKIIIRGSDIVSRSSGSNRIKGASVRIN